MNRFDEFTRERQYLMNVSDHTIRWYRCALKWLPNENPTEDQLNSMVIRMRERGLKATGCNAAIRAINCYLRWSGSPHTVQFLKEPKLVLPTFTNEQVRLLIKYKPKTQFQHRLHLLVMILMDTGCRISEALALHHEDIDLDNMLMKLHGKGDQDRLVPISFQLRKLLFKVEKGPLFRTVNGTAWKRIGALRSVKLHCQKLGFEPPVRTLHAIRHTFATAYLRHGGSVFHLQKMLGHSSLEMSRRYANLSTTDLSAVHKVCPIRRFEANAFEEKRVCLDQQQTFEGMHEEVATTTIRSSGTRPGFEDFRQYIIEHDRVVKMPGRYGNIRFPEFTYTGTIAGFYSEKRGLMLLSGKKADVLSLAATTTRVAEFQIDTMPAKLSADVIRLVDGRNFAHLATLLADGSPHSAPVWIGREGNLLFIAADDNSVKGRNTQRDPRVAISLVDLDDPYSEAQIRGRVIERRRDSDFKYIDAVSKKYVGKPWPYREDVPVALIIEPDHVHYSKTTFRARRGCVIVWGDVFDIQRQHA